ncbi:MAG TPA: phosphoenolpyruvate protein kinase [Gammaproteobacteria bacterium]|nr:phosphoenolpyruvate protein kinase [Gammaproteobacteria bacterium]
MTWLRIACERQVVVRSMKYAFIVGPILIAINEGDLILVGDITTTMVAKMLLTVCVPYLVSTFSSVGAICSMQKEKCQ